MKYKIGIALALSILLVLLFFFVDSFKKDELVRVPLVPGAVVPLRSKAQEPHSLTIAPRLKGKYVAEFSLLLEPETGREVRAYIRQLRTGEIKRVRLRSGKRIEQQRIPFALRKDDILDFYQVNREKPNPIDGVSLLHTIKKKNNSDRVVTAYLAPRALRNGIPARIALIKGNFKYIFNQKMTEDDLTRFVFSPPDFSDELFDLSADPYEKSNIIESRPQIAVTFMKLIRGLEFKQGQKGFLQQLSERLKSLGYF